jgi:hypothetical protein
MQACRTPWAAIAVRWALALAGMAFFAASGVAADTSATTVPVELWDRPRSGQLVMGLPAVQQSVGALMADPASRLVIRHGPGPEPAVQAEEIKAWLVAHAVDPDRIGLRADLAARQPVQLEVAPAR